MKNIGVIIIFCFYLTGCASALNHEAHIGADICKHTYFLGSKFDLIAISTTVLAPVLIIKEKAACNDSDVEVKEFCKKIPIWYYPLALSAWTVVAPLALVDLPFSTMADLGEVFGDLNCKLKRKETEDFRRKDARRFQEEQFRQDTKNQKYYKNMLDEIQ
jgi:uncharacterized protein YceK